ncbi:carboxylesterase/lipase family protein [Antrihabitans sp. YC2-6]|uniref:carboxylesterase/lipase family protein n=1 Tax=Antrihabitans sp. YC2-6 TaxID=2799498 RepID=UPI0018F3552C|nr:carboxylesterase/lipase family protein [Antrihabitans sp. YC2-6]MBJ8344120.1 carboxylesterase/lipase family protein [Antrihabitans sp. YC2-6]
MTSLSEVTTSEGIVRGHREGKVLRWLSIPYAAPPVGDLRLRAPQPARPWTGVRDATTYGNAAIQHASGSRIGARTSQPQSEDCLTVNVTAPAEPSSAPRPVMVFIHGGGYVFGTSAVSLYHGNGLASNGDVVVVSFNYRLNVFGYVDFTQFGTADSPIESNLGLRDQVAALEWVQRNIAAFGGDPANVTIFGESAGAAAVTTLLATPAAKGLFHRAIAQSSPADWGLDADTAADLGRSCVEALGADADNAAEALRSADPHVLRRAAGRVFRENLANNPGVLTMMPVIDGDYLPQHPLDAYADGNAHNVPLIMGTNRHEGSLFAKYLDDLPTNPERVKKMFAQSNSVPLDRIARHYHGYPSERTAIKLGGDFIFWRPTITACEAYSQHAPTYNYRYDYAPPMLNRMGLGATHASELIAVFGFGETKAGRALTVIGGRRDLHSVTERVQAHWLSFARYGAPLTSWPEYKTTTRKTLVFDTTTRVVADIDRDRRLAWALYPRPYAPAADPAAEAAG